MLNTRGRIQYGIPFIFGLLYEYSNLEYVRIHVISRVNQAEHDIHIPVVAPQEYVNIYSTRRLLAAERVAVPPVQGRGAGGVVERWRQ